MFWLQNRGQSGSRYIYIYIYVFRLASFPRFPKDGPRGVAEALPATRGKPATDDAGGPGDRSTSTGS